MHRLDRNKHGGGVIVYTDSCVSAELLMVGPSNLEFLSISVTSPYSTHKHCISVFYRPPSSSPAIFDNVFTVIQQLNLSSFSSFVLIGDFNIDFYNSSHPLFSQLNALLYSFSLTQVVHSPTHSKPNGEPSLIDLALLSDTSQLTECSTIPPLANSDNKGLHLQLKWKVTTYCTKPSQRKIWDYKNANFGRACDLINSTDWNSLLLEGDVNTSTLNWHRRFLEIMSECIPQRTLPKRHNLPWLNNNISRCIRRRNIAFRAWRRSPNPSTTNRYKHLRNLVVSMIRKSRATYFKTLNPSNKKQFWKAIKLLTKQKSTIPTLSQNGVSASTDLTKATMLNEHFSSCFNSAVPPYLHPRMKVPSVIVRMTSSVQKMKYQPLFVPLIQLKQMAQMEFRPGC